MAKIVWDDTGKRYYENGVDHGVLYVKNGPSGAYTTGVPWNGLTTVTESPEGAEANDMYADNIKYGSLRSAETFGATIEAYTYPDEFAPCDGSVEVADGVTIGQQDRVPFGFCYRTNIGSDSGSSDYKLHIVYNATASPSEKAYETVNDNPEAITFSWEIETTPVNVTGHKATSCIVIDSRTADPTKLTALEAKLYGNDPTGEPTLPDPDEIITMMTTEE